MAVAFEATTATYPWALILAIVAVIVAAAVLALVALVRAGRRLSDLSFHQPKIDGQ